MLLLILKTLFFAGSQIGNGWQATYQSQGRSSTCPGMSAHVSFNVVCTDGKS